ncbi:TPA: hypothetical protein DDW35_07105 [Candidatus Sumerlaeota bacterium]|nr:hypothetical protein [Candidatus Sumerlaeota bacterium]
MNSFSVRGFGSDIGCGILQFVEVEADRAASVLNALEHRRGGVEFAQAGRGRFGIGWLVEPVGNLLLQLVPESVLLFEKGGERDHVKSKSFYPQIAQMPQIKKPKNKTIYSQITQIFSQRI